MRCICLYRCRGRDAWIFCSSFAVVLLTVRPDKLFRWHVVVGGLSGLAWDEDENRLYAVSDFGALYHFNISINENLIESVELAAGYPLKNKSGNSLAGKFNDAEGLDTVNSHNGILGDTELVIAYERRPRVTRHRPDGTFLRDVLIGKKLASRKKFQKPNKSLEAVLDHSRLGVLLGPEIAMPGQNPGHHTIFKQNADQYWEFETASDENASFTGIEELTNGDLLVLERTFDDVTDPFTIALIWVRISDCEAQRLCASRTLLMLDSQEHTGLDNYEGLAKLDDYRYLMISDNNENRSQRTLLSLILLR